MGRMSLKLSGFITVNGNYYRGNACTHGRYMVGVKDLMSISLPKLH